MHVRTSHGEPVLDVPSFCIQVPGLGWLLSSSTAIGLALLWARCVSLDSSETYCFVWFCCVCITEALSASSTATVNTYYVCNSNDRAFNKVALALMEHCLKVWPHCLGNTSSDNAVTHAPVRTVQSADLHDERQAYSDVIFYRKSRCEVLVDEHAQSHTGHRARSDVEAQEPWPVP